MKRFLPIFLIALVITIASLVVLTKISPKKELPNTDNGIPSSVRIYVVMLEDNGANGTKFGCNDSLIYTTEEVLVNDDPIRAAVEKLLSTKTQPGDELYNAFSNSNLSVEKVEIRGETAALYLTGQLSLGGVCDNPRIENQLSSTILQFPHIREVEVYINNEPLADILSQK